MSPHKPHMISSQQRSIGDHVKPEAKRLRLRLSLAFALLLSVSCVTGVITVGCESRALSLGVPSELSLILSPPFIQQESAEVELYISELLPSEAELSSDELLDPTLSVTQVVNEEARLISSDFGADLVVSSWRAISPFHISLVLTKSVGAPYGSHEVLVSIENEFGLFEAKGVIFVFE